MSAKSRFSSFVPVLAFVSFTALSAMSSAAVITTSNVGGADAGVDYLNQNQNSGSANAISLRLNSTSNNAVYVKFNISDYGGDLSQAVFTFTKTGSNTTSVNIYGLLDGHAGEGWEESVLTYGNAPGIDTATSSASGIVLRTDQTVFLGNVGFGPGQLNVTLTGSALDSFVAADTNHLLTLIVLPTADRGAFFRTKEFGTAPSLTLPNASAVPEPTLAGGLLFLFSSLLRVRRQDRDKVSTVCPLGAYPRGARPHH